MKMTSPVYSISPSKFEKTVYRRFKKHEKERKKMINELRETQQNIETEKKWSSKTKWSENVKNIEPLHRRLDDVLWKKEQWLKVQQKRKRDKENRDQIKECSFSPNLNLTNKVNKKYLSLVKRRSSLAERTSTREQNYTSLKEEDGIEKEKKKVFNKENRILSAKKIRNSSRRLYEQGILQRKKIESRREDELGRLFYPRCQGIKDQEMQRIREKRSRDKKTRNIQRRMSEASNKFEEIKPPQEENQYLDIQAVEKNSENPTFVGNLSSKNLNYQDDAKILVNNQEFEDLFNNKNRKSSLKKLREAFTKPAKKGNLGSRRGSRGKNSVKSVSKKKKVEKKKSKTRKASNRKVKRNSSNQKRNSSRKVVKKQSSSKIIEKKKKLTKKNLKKGTTKKKEALKAKLKSLDEKIKQYESLNKQILEVKEDIKLCDESLSLRAEKLNTSVQKSISRSKIIERSQSRASQRALSHSKSKKELIVMRNSNASVGSRADSLEKMKILSRKSSRGSFKRRNSRNRIENVDGGRRGSRSQRILDNRENNKKANSMSGRRPPNPFFLERNHNYRIVNLSNGTNKSLKKNESSPLLLGSPLKNNRLSNENLMVINISSDVDHEFDTFGNER